VNLKFLSLLHARVGTSNSKTALALLESGHMD
jgi:hypothetical protein